MEMREIKSPTTNESVQANYSKLSDHIRRLTPQGIQCSVFCGGTNCKYENPENWKADSLAIQGIYSHWITDDILAMARPSTVVIIQKNIIQQFESLGIKSIINLQSPKEHASCGHPLEDSGFSYDPNIFMEHNIYYYNFAWKDYGDATLVGLLNMVKVLAFAITEGRVAIHCHAGLGRTGVLIACYLVYSLRIVHCICERILKLCGCWIDEFPLSNTPLTFDFLFTKLTGKIQRYESTYSLCSNSSDSLFTNDLKSPSEEMSSPTSPNPSENGDPSDSFSELSTLDGDEISEELLIENRCFQELETQKCFNQDLTEKSVAIQDINVAVNALLLDYSTLTNETKKKIKQYQVEINSSQLGWSKLAIETDLILLSMLLFEWIEGLKHPVIRREGFENIVVHYKQPEICFQKFSPEEAYLIEYLLRFISKINPISKDNQDYLIKRIISACSQQTLLIREKMKPIDKGFKKLRDGTLACTLEFFQSLFELIEVHHSLKTSVYLEESKMYNEAEVENDFQ
ncbi:hypothetical protein GEV33_004524 [Tenebrio molitor]|uniref:Tyrosine specific protein phosphatases domain-containing protein n=1 Tax=Tenebrio molitor TaxID=7067 RepID=A0A8J6HPK7_TENMO|nr:hypothetical protein GEV33_004524 [Tenebrio molitor]